MKDKEFIINLFLSLGAQAPFWFFTARKRSFGQGYVCIPVCLFTGGWGGLPTPGCRPTLDTDPPAPWMQTPPPRYGQQVNKRAVRILLECILVHHVFALHVTCESNVIQESTKQSCESSVVIFSCNKLCHFN